MKAWGEPQTPRRRDVRVRPLRPEDLVEPDDGDPRDAIQRAAKALDDLARGLDRDRLRDPSFAALARYARAAGLPVKSFLIFPRWVELAGNSLDPATPWRLPPDEDTARLIGSVAWAEALEFLGESGAGNGPIAPIASALLRSYQPTVEGEFALHVAATDPRYDLVSLWELTQLPNTLDRLWYMASAIAFRYASLAQRAAGPVLSTEGEPIHSGSACLGIALWRLRIYPTLVPALLDFTLQGRRDDGGWGDPGTESDPLTTLVAASFAAGLDPDFDPCPTIEYFKRTQGGDGLWSIRGPEASWLTREILAWLRNATRPYAERFGWPGTLKVNRDRRTGLPTYDYFVDLERSFSELPGLRDRRIELAFIDLAAFGSFNNKNGQARGDEVITAFGRALARVPGVQATRDGGDEFTIIGVPGDPGPSLYDRLDAFRREWATEFRKRFGADHVAPRIIVAGGPERVASGLARTREELGIGLSRLKAAFPTIGPEGVIRPLDEG